MSRLEIINDTEFRSAHSVMSDDPIYRETDGDAEIYVLPLECSDIRILKIDIWRTNNKTNARFKIFKFIFRNLSMAENLPFSVDFRMSVMNNTKLLVSELIKTNVENIILWQKACRIQCITLFLLIVALGGLLSCIFFDGYYDVICFSAVFILDILIFASIAKEQRKCCKFLKKYCL